MSHSADLVIIGSGPGGYVAAIKASQLGLSVILIEREKIGGTCLNWGCIPAKSLLQSASIAHQLKTSALFGVVAENVKILFDNAIKRSRLSADRLGMGVSLLLKNKKVTVLEGSAFLKDAHTVEIRDSEGKSIDTVSAKNILIATGSKAKTIPGVVPDGQRIWTARHALMPKEQPKTLTIIGGGAIGMEMASFYHAMGTQVFVLEGLNRVLSAEDADISEAVRKSYTRRGIEITPDVKISEIKDTGEGVTVSYISEGETKTKKTSAVLLAMGVSPNTEGLGLENVAVSLNRFGGIETDEWGQTSDPSLYAVGDVTVPPFLAHKAARQGIIAVEKMVGKSDVKPFSSLPVPACTFCIPQVASVGLTEEKAMQEGMDIAVGRFPFMGNGRSIVMNATEGFIKTVVEKKTGKILGVHMVGEGVAELIHSVSIAMANGLGWKEVSAAVFPHPTQSEMVEEVLLAAFDEAIHI